MNTDFDSSSRLNSSSPTKYFLVISETDWTQSIANESTDGCHRDPTERPELFWYRDSSVAYYILVLYLLSVYTYSKQ